MKTHVIPKITQVDKNVPIPPPQDRRNIKYPYKQLEVNDSFAVPIKEKRDIYTVMCGVHVRNKRHPDKQFTSRVVTENNKKCVRVWRIK